MMLSVAAIVLVPFLHGDPLAGPAMAAGQRYLDPAVAPDQMLPDPVRRARSATLERRADGEIQLRIEGGFRMEMRARVDASGQLSVNCGTPGHPDSPHAHAVAESGQ